MTLKQLIKHLKQTYPLRSLRIHNSNLESIYIDLINIKSKSKNQGYGTKVMWEICNWCDKNYYIIYLTPSDVLCGDYDRLIKFYERFGFSFYEEDEMIRKPKQLTNDTHTSTIL